MSDTDFERVTNEDVLSDARGDVLIAGLGIGMLPYHLCQLKKVRSVTILELQSEVVALVYPHVKHPKLRMIVADAYHPPLQEMTFDYAYLDIWPQIGIPWTELEKLLAEYQQYAPKVDAWLREYIKIFDTLGIGSLPDMERPGSGWRYHENDGAVEAYPEMVFDAIFGKEESV